METYDIRNLMNGQKRKMPANSQLKSVMNAVDELIVKNGVDDFNQYDWFMAGYVLANPIVREQLMMNKKRQMKIENEIVKEN